MTKIALLDVDGHNYPNLALMKIAAYNKTGTTVEWYDPLLSRPDRLYASKIFSFTTDNQYWPDCEIIKGGTGYDVKSELPVYIDQCCPDYSLYPDFKHALGFLTRGCPNSCPWCIVPEKEGDIKPYADIESFLAGRKTAVLMDNNVLASDWGLFQIEKIIRLGIRVDFNQGLDARLISGNPYIAQLLGRVKWLAPLRMACDTQSQIDNIIKATELLRKHGAKPVRYFVYCLVKDVQDALIRVESLRKYNLDLFCQPFRDPVKNIEPTREQKRFARWVNMKACFKSCKWEDYR